MATQDVPKVTGADAYELERRLGHATFGAILIPPEQVAANHIEVF